MGALKNDLVTCEGDKLDVGYTLTDVSTRARSTMGDVRAKDDAVLNDGSLIDVTGLSPAKLKNAIHAAELVKALDYILAVSDAGTVYNGFNSSI